MKKLLIFLVAFWVFGSTYAQKQSDHKGGVLSGGSVYKDANIQMQFQIGSVFQYPMASSTKVKTAFPFGVLYVPNTFSEKNFEVSKGYYADAVKVSWSIGANEGDITKIQIFRKELQGSGAYNLVATVGKDVFEFDDTQIEGGVIYQYKVVAVGVSNIEQKYLTFIEGIGFRNPTANVSGLITYKGGSPVQDVKVLAEAVGTSGGSFGTSMQFDEHFHYLLANVTETEISSEEYTIQGWVSVSNQRQFYPFQVDNTSGERSEFRIHRTANVLSLGYWQNYKMNLVIIEGKYPTGEVDAFGNDIYAPISDIKDTDFLHLTYVMKDGERVKVYLNGRLIAKEKFQNVEDVTYRDYIDTGFEVYTASRKNGEIAKMTKVNIGHEFRGRIDEVRLWDKELTPEEIRRDYKRYLNGGESGLKMYLRMDEGYGNYAYDISKKGFEFNKNNATKVPIQSTGTNFSQIKPTKDQLGVYGITGKDGTYTISAIPYTGTGEQFKITPSFGVHKFNPASQTLFLGKDEPVANKIDFEDISSFKFNGRVVFDARGVFSSIAIDDPALETINEVREKGYNQYLVNGTVTLNKGEYFYEANEGETISVDETTGNLSGGTLKRYPIIGVEDASLYIDGAVVFDEDNQPIKTDAEGKFSIQVPIGRHKVEVKKYGHTFLLNGRFPEKTENATTNLFDFYEDQIQERWFIDDTRVTVVGRVVGGRIESEKEIGFGFDGLKEHENEVAEDEPENKQIYSSVNNIGQATITFKGDISTSELDKVITTNAETGEYKVELIPYKYTIKSDSGINILENTDINGEFIDSNEELDFTEIKEQQESVFKAEDGTEFVSEPYQYEKSFRYNSPVVLKLIEQEYLKTYKIKNAQGEEEEYDVSALAIPLYKQKQKYRMAFQVTQDYVNNDGTDPVITKEYFKEGEFNINNDLAGKGANDSSIKEVKKGKKEYYVYTFNAGLPNITQSEGFKNTISIEYNIPDKQPITISNQADFKNQGIVIGGRSSGGTTFSTVAPDAPSIILRDPPGSNSFASIEKGTVISFQSSNAKSSENSAGGGLYVSVGPTFESETGTPFFSVKSELNVVADVELNINHTTSINRDGSTTESYEFSETISTSDDPNFVGADGDLYIGNSKNIFYGFFDNMFVTSNIPTLPDNSIVPNISVTAKDKDGNDVDIYISSRKDYFIAEQPSKTFFMYSQKYILETLIPDLTLLAQNIENGIKPDPSKDYQSANFYKKQVELWQKVIQDNERDKYLAFKERNSLKNSILAKAEFEKLSLKKKKNTVSDVLPSTINSNRETFIKSLDALITKNFASNKSFDAGVGEYTASVTTASVVSKTYEKTIDLSTEFQRQLGFLQNNVGAILKLNNTSSAVDTDTNAFEQEFSNTISYTLKDNDLYNALSVDVVNTFNGNGPVFITKGGATSCPYEGNTVSEFYKHSNYDKNVAGEGGEILSKATISVFKPEIKVNKTLITNVPESEDAVFTLQLKNTSTTRSDIEYLLFVDNTSLAGATTNINQNGVRVFLPYDQTVEYPLIISKKSSLSNYKFDGIRVYLGDPCEGTEDIIGNADERLENESDNDPDNDNDVVSAARIDLSVEFKKSCSKVAIATPQDNWIFNRNEAFSTDANGNVINNVLPITFTDFNTDFSGFRKIELQYRNANASNWAKLRAYYGSEDLKTQASDDQGIVIASESEFTFNWDIVGNTLVDGDYEIRAVAYCTDNVTYESKVIKGTINLTPPVVFGTPQPSDGILNIGEDIKIRFNEAVQKHISTNITLRGLKNQQAIDHSVSVRLDGTNNQIELPKQNLQSKSTTVQFWFNNATTASGTLLSQEDGISATLNGNALTFSIAGSSVTTNIINNEYNFYSLVYKDGNTPYLEILKNGDVLKTEYLSGELSFTTSNSIFIGGTGVEGNIHDVRIWQKATTPGQAAAEKDFTLTGKEPKLLGYWMLNEGNGIIGHEKVRRKNAKVGLSWTIKPKGQGYEFANSDYLTLDNVGFVQPTNYEDITMSFWVKASAGESGTIFGNGTGNENPGEPLLTNGFRNKWDVSLGTNGMVTLRAEGVDYQLTNTSIADNNWHHVALVVRRSGSINSYIDGEQHLSVSSANIGGIAGSKLYVGARYKRYIPVDNNGTVTGNATETIENHFTGKLDELRLWNTARSYQQLKRDRYFELDRETTGLLLYVNFNEEEANVATKGPRYNVRKGDGTTVGFLSLLNDGNGTTRNFIEDSPSIKPALVYINVPYTTVINGDEMIISPTLTAEEWSLFEGQILDVSVSGMYDVHYNKQLSPVSFSALVNRQEVEWFTNAGTKEIVAEKEVNQPYSFTMDVINKGGNNQDFTVSGLPVWMKVSATSATVGANAMKQLTFTVDKELAMGSYTADIYLQLEDGYSDRLLLDLRVLQKAPDWSVNPSSYSNSMNIISQIRIQNVLSRDTYTKVGAFVNDEKRGEAYLVYDKGYDSYYAFLTVYSNVSSGETVTFKVWDALNGKTSIATINNLQSISFVQNEVMGTYTSPTIFSTDELSEQNIQLNKGWTWVSFFVKDARFNDIGNTLEGLDLSNGDVIKNGLQFTNYQNGIWAGSLTALENNKAYRIKLEKANTLRLIGQEVKLDQLSISVAKGWNRLSFPVHKNISVQEAMAFYEPTSGDVLKDQYSFAIYDANSGEWKGTLRYMQSNRGYMLSAGKAQTFKYPKIDYVSKSAFAGQPHTNEMINNFSKYSSNMGIVAEIVTQKQFDEVHVFDTKGILRGKSKIVEQNGKQLSFITVFSNTQENLNYTLVNTNKQVALSEGFTFSNNLLLGTLENPVQLGGSVLSTNDVNFEGITLYPNPFGDELIINIPNTSKITKAILYSAIGVKVKEVTITTKVTKIATHKLSSGVYMLQLIDKSGNTSVRKLIKQ